MEANFADSGSLIRLVTGEESAGEWNSSAPNDVASRDLGQKVDLSISQSEALDARVDQEPHSSYAEDGSDADDDQSSAEASERVQISGAGLSYSYRFETIYFRFGSDNKQAGSEHLINSQWHSAELQVVAYNSVLYKSFHEASSRPHGLLAISVLVDVYEEKQAANNNNTGSSSSNIRMNSQLERLLMPLNEIKFRNQMLEVREFNLSALLQERRQFVTYEGSLNIPGCHESVDWLILNRPLYITQSSVSSILLRLRDRSDLFNDDDDERAS